MNDNSTSTFWITSFMWAVAWIITTLNFDYHKTVQLKYLSEGDSLCAQHGGLVSYDILSDFTCKDGVVLNTKNLVAPKTGG